MDLEIIKKTCETLNIDPPNLETETESEIAERMVIAVIDWVSEIEGRLQEVEGHLNIS